MISSEYIYFLIFILLSRISFYFIEKKLTMRELLVKLVVQFIPVLFFTSSFSLFLLVGTLIVINIAEFIFEERQTKRGYSLNGIRSAELAFIFITTSIVFSLSSPINTCSNFSEVLISFKENYIITKNISSLNLGSIGIIILGALFLLNEVNLPVRSILTSLKILPKKGDDTLIRMNLMPVELLVYSKE